LAAAAPPGAIDARLPARPRGECWLLAAVSNLLCHPSIMIRSALPLLLSVAGLGACATTMNPQRFEGPAAAIRAAEEVGAARVPEAALRLEIAKEQFAQAKTMTSETQQAPGDRLLARSQVDAELALALTRSSAARDAARKATGKKQSIEPTTVR
jgi:hypothetical protein